jgi:TolB-like protein/class 3 adenylate cyclase/Tfp pilus assembly protein PilF
VNDASNINRRLAAIVFADVVGYSRLLAINETETLRQWHILRTEIMEPNAVQQGGRVVDRAGDALLIEFSSAVNAVRWAADVQRTIASRRDGSNLFALTLRIGINVEDAIVDGGILQGDGVNIAARIHQMAEPGQIVITSSVRDYVISRLPVRFHNLGTPPMKNIDRPIRVFAVEWCESGEGAANQPYLQWSSRPTIAVLPFRNIGGMESDSYFGEGITEDIITGLSRSRSFYVIARTSTLHYRDRSKDLRQIAGELDVRYVMDGSVRRHASRLRINAELIDVAANCPIWAERFDGTNDDLFEFQDQIVARIVGSLEPRVRAVEVARVRDRPTESLDAYDCVLKALSLLYLFTDESFRQTAELLDRAIALDPSYAQAHAYVAWWYNFWVGENRSSDPTADKQRALDMALRAVELDPEDAFALTVAAHLTAFFAKRPNEAFELFNNALKINENSTFAWGMSALTCAYQGRADDALERLRNVWRLSPFEPLNFYFWIVAGIAEFVAGRYDEAVAWLRKSQRANPRFHACQRMLAASLALSGDEVGASLIAQEALTADPSFRVSTFVSWYPLQQVETLQRLETGLLMAGMPK